MKGYQTPNPQCASLLKMHDYAVQARSTANCTFLVPNHYIHKNTKNALFCRDLALDHSYCPLQNHVSLGTWRLLILHGGFRKCQQWVSNDFFIIVCHIFCPQWPVLSTFSQDLSTLCQSLLIWKASHGLTHCSFPFV